MKRIAILCLVLIVALTGCATTSGPKETVGTGLGALGGGLLGAQVGGGSGRLWAVGIGTLAGALLGREVGSSLDRADRLYMERTAQTSLETSPSYSNTNWRNPDSGNYGSFTPTNTYYAQGKPCREYQQTVTIGGRPETLVGTACREGDGSWRIVQ